MSVYKPDTNNHLESTDSLFTVTAFPWAIRCFTFWDLSNLSTLLTAVLVPSHNLCLLTCHITSRSLLLTTLQSPCGGGHTSCNLFGSTAKGGGPLPPTSIAKIHTFSRASAQWKVSLFLHWKICNLWFAPTPSFYKLRLRTEVTFRLSSWLDVVSDRPLVRVSTNCNSSIPLPGIWPHPHHTLGYLAPPRFTHVIKTGLSQTLIDPPLSASCWEQRGEGRGDFYKLVTALGGDRWR